MIEGHKVGDPHCKAKEKECRDCKTIGHYAGSKCCKLNKPNKNTKSVKLVTENDSEDDDTVHCFAVDTKDNIYSDNDKLMVKLNFETNNCAKSLDFQIETGSKVSLLPFSIYEQHFNSASLSETNTVVTNYSRDKIVVVGCLCGSLSLNGKQISVKLFVVSKGSSIVGMDVISG